MSCLVKCGYSGKDGVLFMYDIPSFFIYEYLKFISCYFPLVKRLLAFSN